MKKPAYKPNIEWRLPRMRKCVVCGNKFPVRNFAKTCSPKCSRNLWLANRRKYYAANSEKILAQQHKRQRPIIKQCVLCEKEFDNRKGAKTCSAKCRKAYRKEQDHKYYEANPEKWARAEARRRERKRAAHVPKFKPCVICGKKFDATGDGKRNTCSPQHRLERKQMMERTRYAADLEKHRAKGRAKAKLRRLEAKAPA